MRRPSLHEKDKDAMSAKDARDEARHVVEMMAAAAINNEDDDGEDEEMKTETEKVCSHVQLIITLWWQSIVMSTSVFLCMLPMAVVQSSSGRVTKSQGEWAFLGVFPH